jgi:hypothetical protein
MLLCRQAWQCSIFSDVSRDSTPEQTRRSSRTFWHDEAFSSAWRRIHFDRAAGIEKYHSVSFQYCVPLHHGTSCGVNCFRPWALGRRYLVLGAVGVDRRSPEILGDRAT